ncbi:MAG: hypothetical protein M0Z79_13745 [Nitrospiraceae bacterium]|nr:hypothetical protein [Nitrospiraceae bacterium]
MIGAAIKVAKIATGEVEDESMAGKEYAQKGGLKGGKERSKKLPAEKRRAIALYAAQVRWAKSISKNK